MKKLICGAFAAALLGSAALPAFAADLPSTKAAPVYAPVETFDPFLVRVRALGFLPNATGSSLAGSNIYDAKLQNNVVPEVDITYFINKNWALEAICCVVHTRLTGALTPHGATQNIANTTLFPPTVTLQYHFALGQFDPYVGVGVNYTWFWGTTSVLTSNLGYGNAVNLRPAAGVDFNAGFDYYLTKNWVLNADAKYLLLHTTGNTPFGVNTVSLNANTWLVGVGIGYRFGLPAVSAPVVAKY
jgi:outer membrane protein